LGLDRSCRNQNLTKIKIFFYDYEQGITSETKIYSGNKKIGSVVDFSIKNDTVLIVVAQLDSTYVFHPRTKFILKRTDLFGNTKIEVDTSNLHLSLGPNEYEGINRFDEYLQGIRNRVYENQDSVRAKILQDSILYQDAPNIDSILRRQAQKDSVLRN